VLTFSSALDPTRAQDIHNYMLVRLNSSGHGVKKIRVASAAYSSAAHTVTLHPAKRLYLFALHRLVVNGTAPLGLASPSGVLLDGAGNGVPGTNYVKVFGPSILAEPHPPLPGSKRSVPAHSKSPTTHLSIGEHRPHLSASAMVGDRAHRATPRAAFVRLNERAVDAALGALERIAHL
jgi:hypothetical protein